ncbi:MAG: hypothetical protein HOQ18_07195 [Dermatophilaceae bacterium]|nr:hypothetical protein [Dermatophilaceae bacterium]
MQCLLDEGHKSGHDILGDMVLAVAEGKCLSSYLPVDECRSCDVAPYPNLCGRRIEAGPAEPETTEGGA